MIKVLFLIHDLGHGGAEKVLVNLVNNMDRTKFDITVMTMFGGGVNEQFLKSDINYKVLFEKNIPGNSKLMKLLSPEKLHRMFIKEKYDVEIAYLEGPSARVISGCPDKDVTLMTWIHGQQHNRKIAAMSFRSYEEAEACYKKMDKIVCVSESVKEDFKQLFPAVKKLDVKYNTNETDEILRLQHEEADDVFTEGEIRLCGMGKVVASKGFDKLARIHKRLRDDGYPVHTYILGVGADQDKIEKYTQENRVEDTFTFLGYQTNPYKYLAKCDVFVCASIGEGFSTAATEALILGVPVVTTPVGGMREMLGEDEYGLIAEMDEDSLYEKLKFIVEDAERLKHYKKQAKNRGESFSKETTVRAVEKMIEQMK